MVHFASLVVFSSLVAVTFGNPIKRDVPTVEADIANIASQVTTLDNAINAFPDTGGSLASALAIHNDAVSLNSALQNATTDVKATSAFSESDGSTILADVQSFVPTIIDALNEIVAKKPAFDALPIGGISAVVGQDLTNLDASTTAFESALVADTPADLVAQAASLTSSIDAAFATAKAAYGV